MTQSNLPEMLSALRDSDTNTTRFDDNWSQGRSAFGGLSAAFAVTAMNKLVADDMPLRSLMVSFIAPVPAGEVTVQTRIQRQGKNVTQLGADLISGGNICLQAMGVYGRGRKAISVAPQSDFNPLPRANGISFAEHTKRLPSFLKYFDGCWAGGGLPFSGKPDRELNLWAKHLGDLSQFPAESLIAIADIPPPVVLSHFNTPPVPASSLTWSLEFIRPAAGINCEWFYLHFDMDAAADGYTQQSGKIFSEDGMLCALSRQCMVYFT